MPDPKTANVFAPYELQIDVADRKKIVAPLLVELRESKHLTQRQVAELLGVSPQAYNGWEKARNEPPIEHLVRLSFLYGVSVDTLCGRNVFSVPTKENVTQQLNTYRQQIAAMQAQLDSGELDSEPERKVQMQAMLDGLRAIVGMAQQANGERE